MSGRREEGGKGNDLQLWQLAERLTETWNMGEERRLFVCF